MIEVLFFSDPDVKRKLFDRVRGARRPLLVAQVRHEPGGRDPARREPFATLERALRARVDIVLVADEGRPESMWRDPVGDLAEALFPEERDAAYVALNGYLVLLPGGGARPLGVTPSSVKRQGAVAADILVLQARLAQVADGVPARAPEDDEVTPARSRRTAAPPPPAPPAEPAMVDPWQVLGVAPGTPLPVVKKAFHALIAQYHPDKVSHLALEFRELAEKRTRALLEAWQRIESGQVD